MSSPYLKTSGGTRHARVAEAKLQYKPVDFRDVRTLGAVHLLSTWMPTSPGLPSKNSVLISPGARESRGAHFSWLPHPSG